MIEVGLLKHWLKIEGSRYDDILSRIEAEAVDLVSREVGHYFGPPRAAVEILDGRGVSLFLRETPVGGQVVISTRVSIGAPWVVEPTENYELDGRHVIHVSGWPIGRRNIRAEYNEGYAPGSEPPEIVRLVREIVESAWKFRGTGGAVSQNVEGISYVRAEVEKLPTFQ